MCINEVLESSKNDKIKLLEKEKIDLIFINQIHEKYNILISKINFLYLNNICYNNSLNVILGLDYENIDKYQVLFNKELESSTKRQITRGEILDLFKFLIKDYNLDFEKIIITHHNFEQSYLEKILQNLTTDVNRKKRLLTVVGDHELYYSVKVQSREYLVFLAFKRKKNFEKAKSISESLKNQLNQNILEYDIENRFSNVALSYYMGNIKNIVGKDYLNCVSYSSAEEFLKI